jgi:flagellar biosynthetic protein FliO
MTSILTKSRWMVLLAWCCGVNCIALTARPVSGEVATDDAVLASPKSVDRAAGSKLGLTFPSAPPAEMPFRGDAELFSTATRATGSVVLLVGLILIGAFLLKRYWPGRFGAVTGERQIEVLETVALGERQSLTLVQVGQSRLLLARTTGSITLLDRTELLPEAVLDSEMDALTEPQEGNRNVLPAAIPAIAGIFKRIEARLTTILARLRTALRRLPPKPRIIPAVKAPSFDQVMHAELCATALTTAGAGSSVRSRLSEIRDRLQAE